MLFFSFAFGFGFIFIKDMISDIKFTKGYGLIINSGKNYFILLTLSGKYYVNAPLHMFNVGDIIFTSGRLDTYIFKTLEGDFNYGQYLKNIGIKQAFIYTDIKVMINSPLRILKKINLLSVNYPAHLNALKNLLLAKEINYNDNFINEILSYNMLFIISLTGAHLSLLRRGAKAFLSIFLQDYIAEFISYLTLLPLFILQITKFAFYRIFLTGIYKALNKHKLKSYFSYLEVNVFVALTFLFVDPYFLFSEAFYIAYLLIFSFILLRPKSGIKGIGERLIILFIILIPYQILSKGSLNIFMVILPLFLTPLYALWYSFYFLTLPFPFLHNAPITILNVIYHIISFVNKGIFIIYLGTFSIFLRTIFIIALVIFLFSYYTKIIPFRRFASFTLLFSLLYQLLPLENQFMYSAYFINVGQGDSILFNLRGKSLLVDTGGLNNKDVAKDVLIPFMKKKSIYSLDYLVITHDDFDHSGGKDSLVQNFKVKTVIEDKKAFPLLINSVSISNLNHQDYTDKNDNSLILYVKFPKLNILLMGDASVKNEDDLLKFFPDLKVDILKIGHHGSNTSTSEAFIRHYRPKYAVISVGHLNKYGHPHKEVVEILNKYNVKIKRTDIDGTISVNSCII